MPVVWFPTLTLSERTRRERSVAHPASCCTPASVRSGTHDSLSSTSDTYGIRLMGLGGNGGIGGMVGMLLG